MRKSLIASLVVLLFVGVSFADIDLGGKFQFELPVADSVNKGSTPVLDYTGVKAELNLMHENFKAELDIPVAHPNGAANIVVDQAYLRTPIANGEVHVGIFESTVGKLKSYSILTPAGALDSEVEGLGVRCVSEINGVTVEVGNIGTLVADKTDSTNDRIIYGQVVSEVMDVQVKAAAKFFTDTSAEKSDLDIIGDIEINNMPNTLIQLHGEYGLTHDTSMTKIILAGIAAKYQATDQVAVYGSYGGGVNNSTKQNNVETDVIAGVSYQFENGATAGLELQQTRVNSAETANKSSIVFSNSF
jgi:hypothetical protein